MNQRSFIYVIQEKAVSTLRFAAIGNCGVLDASVRCPSVRCPSCRSSLGECANVQSDLEKAITPLSALISFLCCCWRQQKDIAVKLGDC